MAPDLPLTYQDLLIADTRRLTERSRMLREQARAIVAIARTLRETIAPSMWPDEPRHAHLSGAASPD